MKALSITVFISAILAAVSARADDPDWAALRSAVGDDNARVQTRIAALSLACDRADVYGAADLAALATTWVDSIDQSGLSRGQLGSDPMGCAEHSLVCAVTCANGVCLDSQNNPEAMLALWTSVATRSWADQHVKEAAFQLIANSQASLPARKAAALAILRDSGG